MCHYKGFNVVRYRYHVSEIGYSTFSILMSSNIVTNFTRVIGHGAHVLWIETQCYKANHPA
jgi:hypothetical protein